MEPVRKSILIEHATLLTQNDAGTVYREGYVWISGDRIAAVGQGESPAEYCQAAERRIDGRMKAVIPGLINSHTHLFQSFLRGLADDRPLLEWLNTAIFPTAKHLRGDEAHAAARLGLIENIRSGVTSVIDHQYVHTEPAVDDGMFQAAAEIGIRYRLAYGWADMNYDPTLQLTPGYIKSEATRLYHQWHGQEDGRLQFEFGPVIPWGCSDETMRMNFKLAKRWGVGMHVHIAETEEEVSMNIRSRGSRHVEWLHELGMLDADMQLVHSIWLNDHELDLIQETGAIVVHCPVSNMYLASGAARISEMQARGINIALATDGPGSNNNQDMLEVLKTTALLAKHSTQDAMALLPDAVLHFATRGGAQAFGQADTLGSLEVGKKADLAIIDLNSPFAMPVHHPASALVYNLGPAAIDTVIIDGKVVMENRQITVIDEEQVLEEARKACSRLFARART